MNSNVNADENRIPGNVELTEFAYLIEHNSHGKVRAFLDRSIVANITTIGVKIMSSGAGRGSYELLQVRALDLQYPVVLEVTHFDDERRISKKTDTRALKDSLMLVLEDARTRKIIQLFADEAVAPIKTSEPRPFLIAQKPFDYKGTPMAHVAFLGFGGFLSLKTMHGLAKEPDSEGSAVQTYDNKYVATFKFEGDVKVTLSPEELEALQRSARSIVDGTEVIPPSNDRV